MIQDTRKYQATVQRLEANHRRMIEMQIYLAKKHDRSITQKQIVLKTMTTTFLSLKNIQENMKDKYLLPTILFSRVGGDVI